MLWKEKRKVEVVFVIINNVVFYCDTMHTKSAFCYCFRAMSLPEGKHWRGVIIATPNMIQRERMREEKISYTTLYYNEINKPFVFYFTWFQSFPKLQGSMICL